jgi:hypothetical protein
VTEQSTWNQPYLQSDLGAVTFCLPGAKLTPSIAPSHGSIEIR